MAGENVISQFLVPTVKWAQNRDVITLKIELMQCKNPDLNLQPQSLRFQATGIGAQGEHVYSFTINFLKDVNAESIVHRVMGSHIEIFMSKQKAEWWPRLTKQAKSPHFLKLDFDKWTSESDDEEEKQKKDHENLMSELLNEKAHYEATLKKLKTSYLIIYNLIQWLIYLYIFLFCMINIARGGSKIFPYTYSYCGKAVQLAVGLSWLEVIHPYTGITKGSWATPCLQCYGRSFVMFCLWLTAEEIQFGWYITMLFTIWSGIEVIRYPLYVTQLLKVDAKILTWLRYNIWIPLYPLGTFMEIMVYKDACYAISVDNLYEIQLPNAFNISFKFTWIIQLQMAALVYAIAFILMPHMWKQRKIKLGHRIRYKEP